MAASKYSGRIPLGRLINEEILNASRDEFRALHPSAAGRPYDKVVVGAAAFRYESGLGNPRTPRILLLKRAADETYFPNVFELPSGKVDLDDASIKHALLREVQEETGLNVTGILAELKPMIYTTEKTVVDDNSQSVFVSKSAIQLNYVVSISEGNVELSANEHSESNWATQEESESLEITDAMNVVVREAFTWATGERLAQES